VETEDPHTGHGGDTTSGDDNIVRLPRDWLGPRDELVPIAADPDPGDPLNSPTAADFWGEASAAVQEVEVAEPAQAVSEAGRAARVRDALRPRASSIRRLRPRASPLRAVAAGLVAAAIVALALQVIGGSGGSTSRPPMPARMPLFSSLGPRLEAGAAVTGKIAAHRLATSESRGRTPAKVARPRAHLSRSLPGTVVVSQTSEPNVTILPAPPETTPAAAAASVSSTSTGAQPTVSNPRAFGANGLLGPGHSPNG
jgi:hypothetical protein